MNKNQLFQELYEQHKDRIYRLCKIMVFENSYVSDLYQEVLINLWKGIDQFYGKSKIETWIYRVVVNASINFNLKQERYRDKINKVAVPADLSIKENNLNDKLLEAINHLVNADKAIIGLYLEGYKYKEMAEILGMTSSGIGVRINRIKLELKSVLDKNKEI